MLKENFRRRLMDKFLRDVFFEIIEAGSLEEYAAVFRRVFFPPKEIMGNRTYVPRFFKGFLRLLHI